MISLRTVTADDWRAWRNVRLQALRDAPYAFGSTLAQWQGEGDTESRWRDRLRTVPFNVMASVEGTACGMVSATAPDADGAVELISMWVAPPVRGRGVGDALVQAVMSWAAGQRARRVVLDVVAGNEQAIALYERHGFVFTTPDAAGPNERSMTRDLRREGGGAFTPDSGAREPE